MKLLIIFSISFNSLAHDHKVPHYKVPNYLSQDRLAKLNYSNLKLNDCLIDTNENIEKIIKIDNNKMITVNLEIEDKIVKVFKRRIVFKNELNRDQLIVNCQMIEDFNNINKDCFSNTSLSKYFCKKGE